MNGTGSGIREKKKKENPEIHLKKNYIAGSQMWFEKGKFRERDTQLRGYGCGIVALLDFCVYVGAIPPAADREEYRARVRKLNRRAMPIVPGLGMAPYLYPLFANRFFRKNRIPYRIRGIVPARPGERELSELREMLQKDIPVIFAAGPVIPILFPKKRISLYIRENGEAEAFRPSGQSVRSHYMTLLGISGDGEYFRIASWGEEYWIKASEHRRFARYCYPFTNRFFRIRKIKK